MSNWIIQYKDELTTIAAVSGLGLSLYNIFRNHSIGKAKIKIKPVPVDITLTNFAGGEDDTKMYFQFEVINRSIFAVTIKESQVLVNGKWHDCVLLDPYDHKLPIRVDARSLVQFILQAGNGDFKVDDYESVKVCLSDDQEFTLSKRAIRRVIK